MWLARQGKLLHIKRLRHERPSHQEEQMSLRIAGIRRVGIQDQRAAHRIERRDVEGTFLTHRIRAINEMASIGQEAWTPMLRLALAKHRRRGGYAASRRNLLKNRSRIRTENDHAALAPTAALIFWGGA